MFKQIGAVATAILGMTFSGASAGATMSLVTTSNTLVSVKHLAAIISVVTHEPRDPAHYKRLLAGERDLVHVTVEVQACRGDGCLAA